MTDDGTQNSDTEQDWKDDGHREYDSNRWNPEDSPSKCQVCESWLQGSGDRSTVAQHCPECEVLVWIA